MINHVEIKRNNMFTCPYGIGTVKSYDDRYIIFNEWPDAKFPVEICNPIGLTKEIMYKCHDFISVDREYDFTLFSMINGSTKLEIAYSESVLAIVCINKQPLPNHSMIMCCLHHLQNFFAFMTHNELQIDASEINEFIKSL
jgi:hypothetical protein